MPSTAQRAAMSRALGLLSARERNVLTQNRNHGFAGVMDLLRADKQAAQDELDRIKRKLETHTRREMRRPPEGATRSGSSLAPPDTAPRLDGPALRSSGALPASTPARKRSNFKEKDCVDCGKRFKPHGPRQIKCAECRGEAPVTVRHDESVKREPPTVPVSPPPSEPRPVEEAALDAAGIEPPSSNGHAPASEYPRLRSELAAIRRQLDDFAAGLDRLMESNDTRAKE